MGPLQWSLGWIRRQRHIARTENNGPCWTINAYLILYPWRSTRWPFLKYLAPRWYVLIPTSIADLGSLFCWWIVSIWRRKLPHPCIQRMGTHNQSLRNLWNRISSFNKLMHCISFEIVTEFSFVYNGLLASKLGMKVSTNHRDIQRPQSRLSLYGGFNESWA